MKRIPQEVKNQIENLYLQTNSAEKVSKMLNISASATVSHLKTLGYDFSSKTVKITLPYNEALKKFKTWEGSLTSFCKKYKICLSHFTKYLRKNGIYVENKQNAVKFNQNVFDCIDTEEKAYWLGFLYADGYISKLNHNKSDYHFELSLKGEDVEHLNKFNRFMEHVNNNVHFGTSVCNGTCFTRCRWLIRNRHLWETLNSYGCTPNKTLTLSFPNDQIFQPEDLIKHFIRGYFDGDGCVSYSNKTHTRPCISLLGTKQMLNSILKVFVWTKALPRKINKIYTFSTSGKTAMKILHYLYDDATVYLDRKYQRYIQFCRLEEESSKSLQDNIGEG